MQKEGKAKANGNYINSILAHHTGKTDKEIDRDTERENFMSAEQSVTYGMIDKVIGSRINPE